MQVRPVIEYLQALEEKGQTHILLDEAAKQSLRKLFKESRSKAKSQVSFSKSVKEERVVAVPQQQKESTPSIQAAPHLISSLSVPEGNASSQIEALKKQALEWGPARCLGTLREHMVFSVGNVEADLMLVGEAPGYHEERLQEPFVGPAGQKLTAMLKAMGIQREDVYISNIVKFRPAADSQKLTPTSNRAPSQQEMDACLPIIEAEVHVVKPKCIIALGATAGNGLLGGKRAVGAMRGSFHEFAGVPVRVTYHPSYILRAENGPDAKKSKRAVWEDMLAVMEYLQVPISDKQRSYFL